MAKSPNQKLKLIFLMKILLDRTDETHSMTMNEILDSLNSCGIQAERKSIYNDLETLRVYGIDIIGQPEKGTYRYYVANRQFELAELKLLVDAVQSSKFITAKKSHELIKKIESFTSIYEATQLQRYVFVSERVKTMNESIYYSVDKIHTAISANAQINFKYFEWSVDKKMQLRKDGASYIISPWALTWDDANYYMIGFDGAEEKIKHYRVDKMIGIEMTKDRRDGAELFDRFDMAVYSKRMFGMFGGSEKNVKIIFENHLIGVAIDRFGKDVTVIPEDNGHFSINVRVAVSNQFFGWLFGLGGGAKIVSPPEVVDLMRKEARRLAAQYY
ncbi:helix-turn-helix transcriptional regulator [Parasporobacterium paucivorans]|uniref:Predicted DNA-binding transcriptional regulator YafY, contains an HTH and WYL domains n=1 Tax=Parasporobacterium paucivorans DSM 15970 TaxID=1122934 RepID=A0A1M6HXP9_9FIRM|nr:WYL domain-containing protein [Parasporobacterium paucivorans]SHJ27012.1 Predicted DNA-binding transcriptional regulator YafY, contains an HTH and WYL domains [Parasporobacterium paucivorans DSM 15970]